MINITAFLLSHLILFSSPSASGFDNLFNKIKINNLYTNSMKHMPTINQANGYLAKYNNDVFPDFILNFNYSSYHKAISAYKISFSLESEVMLHYSASLLDSHNIELDNKSGFVNNSIKTVNLEILDIQPGEYQFILEIIDDNKQMKEITQTIVIP